MASAPEQPAPGAAALPSDDVLRGHVAAILEGQDLTQMSMKEVRGLLETRCGMAAGALDEHKAKVKEVVTAKIAELQDANDQHEDAASAAVAPAAQPSAGAKQKRADRKPGEPGAAKKKQSTLCTRKSFMKNAKTFPVKLGDNNFNVAPREFSTGSCGYFLSSKVPMELDGERVMMQCSLNCTVIGSKEWKND
ncbi:unnamed protein product [Prorocentrum cordatum]|uniref:DEK-C domain-containing protein n=1 Tax=Prorocentrum cordatum TaxID=2364126 RepID=A0ABN9SZS3_9DINO|nr:unnamed protein product [Polarella glacialis]